MLVNLKSTKICILCRHFYNPTNQGITLKPGPFAEIDNNLRCPCLKMQNLKIKATHKCAKFEQKI